MKKKVFALTMAAVMAAASLTGCGSKEAETQAAAQETSTAQAEGEATEAEETTEAAAEAEGGVLVMATNAEFEPWEYHDGDSIVGIDVEIAQAIADKLGMELQIEDMAFDAIIPSVVSGNADI